MVFNNYKLTEIIIKPFAEDSMQMKDILQKVYLQSHKICFGIIILWRNQMSSMLLKNKSHNNS